MVKLSLKGAQDPTDPSLQMKVFISINLRSGNISYLDASYPLKRKTTPKYMQSVFSLETKWSPNLNSGIIWEGNSRLRALKVKFLQLMRSSKADQAMLKPSELSWDMSQGQETTTCTRNTEMLPWMEPWVNSMQKWQETIVPLLIQFLSSELQFSTRRMRLEDPNPSNSETASLSFPF